MTPVGFDNTILSVLLNPFGRLPTDAGGQPIEGARRRVEFLVEQLGQQRRRIIVPTPVAAELLTAIGPDAQQYFDVIGRSRLFELASFDPRCAVELAFLNRDVFGAEDRRNRLEPYQKVKFDRQTLAILKVAGVATFYTDDGSLAKRARVCGMQTVTIADLPLPDSDRQLAIRFEGEGDIPAVRDDMPAGGDDPASGP